MTRPVEMDQKLEGQILWECSLKYSFSVAIHSCNISLVDAKYHRVSVPVPERGFHTESTTRAATN